MSDQQLDSLDQQLESYQAVGRRRSPRRPDQANAGTRHDPTAARAAGTDQLLPVPDRGSPAWMRFAAAAGASLAAASNADATIQHVVPAAPIRVNIYGPNYAYIDLDGLAGDDLLIAAGSTDPYPYYGYRLIGFAYGLGGATLIGASYAGPFSSIAVRRFNSGDTIPAEVPALSGSLLQISATNLGTLFTYSGQFGINNTGFAGFVNSVGGSLHAGWIKIRTEPSIGRLFAVSVLEWAYEDVAGRSILAGQTVGNAGIPGDYNNNGIVDAADFTVWRDHLGQTFELENEDPADANPGVVDQDDYAFWKSQFGTSGSGAGASTAAAGVPEPSTVSLGVLALGAAGVAALRRRSR
jgi:hypothetical protein